MSTSESVFVVAWARRREEGKIWTKTDSARWLDERSEAVFDHYVREYGMRFIRKPAQMGLWMRGALPKNFAVVHERLLRAGSARGALVLDELLKMKTQVMRKP